MTANCFSAMREFFNTVRHVGIYFGVYGAVAKEIQHAIACGFTQNEVQSIADAHQELTTQIGF